MSNTPIVIMLGHRAKSGKDQFAKFLRAKAGFHRVAFADRLKETVADLYNLSHEQMYGKLKDVMDTRYPNLIDPEVIRVRRWKYLPFFLQKRIKP